MNSRRKRDLKVLIPWFARLSLDIKRWTFSWSRMSLNPLVRGAVLGLPLPLPRLRLHVLIPCFAGLSLDHRLLAQRGRDDVLIPSFAGLSLDHSYKRVIATGKAS